MIKMIMTLTFDTDNDKITIMTLIMIMIKWRLDDYDDDLDDLRGGAGRQGGKAWREFEGPRPNGRRAYKSVPAVIISNITNNIISIIIIYK